MRVCVKTPDRVCGARTLACRVETHLDARAVVTYAFHNSWGDPPLREPAENPPQVANR